jgi:hypothetical protein
MKLECLSPIEVKAMHIIDYATQNQTPDFIVFWLLYKLANGCKQNDNEADYQAILQVIDYVLEP